MSDFIETYGERAAFASLREPGWHDLGTVFTKPVNVQELLALAHLNAWNVRVIEVEAPGFNFGSKKYYFVVRDNPFVPGQVDVLHVSKQRYTPFQNEQLFDMADGVATAGGRWETAGSVKEGAVVFGSISIDRETILDPTGVAEVIKNYIVMAQSHDGSMAITGANTPVRVVCSNTLNFALKGAVQTFKFRHTPTADAKAKVIKQALANAHGYIDAMEGFATLLMGKSINDVEWNKIMLTAYPKPDKEEGRGYTMWDKKFTNLVYLRTSETNAPHKDNAWGALNVLLEDLDWFRTGRGANASENLASARAGFDPVVNTTRNKFAAIVKDAVGV